MSEDKDLEMDFGADTLTLVDDEGEEHEFEVLDSAEIDGLSYLALAPVFDEPEELLEDNGELVVMKVVEEDGEEFLESIEDEDEFKKVADFFMDRLSDTFDFEA